MTELCDTAYCLLVERVERQTLVDQQIIATYRAAGVQIENIQSVEEALAEFDEALSSPPEVLSPQTVFLRELGLVA